MQKTWDKVARWAGIGNNGSDAQNGSSDEMVDEMKDGVEPVEGSVGRAEAGLEEHGGGSEQAAVEAAQIEIAQLKGEKDQLVDRLARLQAEFDNARKREEKTRFDVRASAIGDAVEPFLGVMDNFQLALKSDGSAEQLRGGVQLILKQMDEALKTLQVTPVETVGAQFDPRIHEALGSIETPEYPDHQVIEEIRRGYKIREKLLRPAMVKIAVNPAQVND
jgi:molecular chaperone GrpE